ncbi:MAG: gamma-glutamylcyclotransferase [Gammaproteobacteria bacterium]|nr:gamma-glutamylcyclotransferase [Gammaproteobacteria bacterium]
MLHFGYGSNLSIKSVHEDLNPNAKYVMKGFLPNFEVSWPMWSEEEQSGYSGIMEAPGEMVHGALFEMTEQELIAMDNLEDCYKGTYKRETFLVLGEDDKWHEAELYRVIDPKGPFPPARSYVEIMLAGAKELELDSEYIEKIEEFYRQSR